MQPVRLVCEVENVNKVSLFEVNLTQGQVEVITLLGRKKKVPIMFSGWLTVLSLLNGV